MPLMSVVGRDVSVESLKSNRSLSLTRLIKSCKSLIIDSSEMSFGVTINCKPRLNVRVSSRVSTLDEML